MARKNFFAEARRLVYNQGVYNIRYRAVPAEFNTGTMILRGPDGRFRLINATFTAIGGAAAGATSINLASQHDKVNSFLVVVPVAALVQDVLVTLATPTVAILLGGTSFKAVDKGAPIQIGKAGGNLTGVTHIDINLTYAID